MDASLSKKEAYYVDKIRGDISPFCDLSRGADATAFKATNC